MPDPEILAQQQLEMAAQVAVCPDGQGYAPQPQDLWFTFDVQYDHASAYAAVDVQTAAGQPLGVWVKGYATAADYLPGFFAFREGPVLQQALADVCLHTGWVPQLLVVDGHGRAHPRKFGVACWLGVTTQIPSLGCAKETLVMYSGSLGGQRGDQVPIEVEGETVGLALRTRAATKPLFVSPGHGICLGQSRAIVLQLATDYRQIEPVRRADQAARAFAKGLAGPYTRME
jgi:deoxyribonuclease V